MRSVQTWRRVYRLRVMVFVEYESEVDEEHARVQALLEKLRIDAEVCVFWLASGHLNTYELIINGASNDLDFELIVNEALKDESWWDDLQSFRGVSAHMSASQELTKINSILDSTTGRAGVYNPHEDGLFDRRRASVAAISDIPKRPDIAMLSKMGVSMGIHTHRLNEVFEDDSSTDYLSDSDVESSESEIPWGSMETARQTGYDDGNRSREPLLAEDGTVRRRGRKGAKKNSGASSLHTSDLQGSVSEPAGSTMPSYGTMSTSQTLQTSQGPPALSLLTPEASMAPPPPKKAVASHKPNASLDAPKKTETFPAYDPPGLPPPLISRRSRSLSPTRRTGTTSPRSGAVTPSRPGISRQSSAVKFSSRPVPETRIIGEDSRISFVAPALTSPATPLAERPTHSRQSSFGITKILNRPVLESQASLGDGAPRSIQFVERPTVRPAAASHSRHHSRQGSQYSSTGSVKGDLRISIPELEDTYRAPADEEGGSTYSTQSVALSFNDLPSRAQHLILNELMKQHSKDTAVLLSTLPIPTEGTCKDEVATIQYLSNVELLCSELPPTLMVLSNSMTVTVSL